MVREAPDTADGIRSRLVEVESRLRAHEGAEEEIRQGRTHRMAGHRLPYAQEYRDLLTERDGLQQALVEQHRQARRGAA